MDNQQQFNEEEAAVEPVITTSEFSTRRRVFTVAITLVAALLLGYVLYTQLFQPAPVQDAAPAITQPELSEEEQIRARLEAMQRPDAQPATPEEIERMKAMQRPDAQPATPEEIERMKAMQR